MRRTPSAVSASAQASAPVVTSSPERRRARSRNAALPSRPPQKVGADIPITR